MKNVDHLDTNSKTIAERQEFSFRKYFDKLLRFKGQLISKGLIVILNSSKNERNNSTYIRGHSTTTWTNFDPILTPSPPRVDKRGYSTY